MISAHTNKIVGKGRKKYEEKEENKKRRKKEKEEKESTYISNTAGPGFISSNSINDQHFVLTYSPFGFQCLNSNNIAEPNLINISN